MNESPSEQFLVVRNDEEQFSIWPAARTLPEGWYAEGFTGSRSACLEQIKLLWVDMRPLSLRAFRSTS